VGARALVWAFIGIGTIFVMNLGVSFYLALRLALRAQDVSQADHLAIRRTFLRHLRECPRDFLFPPPETPPQAPKAPHQPEVEPV
jgi:site-specific recombinase